MTKYPYVGEAWWVEEVEELPSGAYKLILRDRESDENTEIIGMFIDNEDRAVGFTQVDMYAEYSELARQIIIDWCNWEGDPAVVMENAGDKYLVELFNKHSLVYVPKERKVPGE